MKRIFTILFLSSFIAASAQSPCEDGFADGYPCKNVDQMSFLTSEEIGGGTINDVWGWTSPETGREYALVGRSSGSSFLDITDPVNPVIIGNLPTQSFEILWRDIKVFNNYAFVVSEAGAHGMQVFDLLKLDAVTDPPVVFEADVVYNGFGNAHNIAINEESGYAYAIGTNTFSGGLHIIDINDPLNPVFAGAFPDDGYTHDCQAVNYHGPDADYQNSEIVFAANTDAITIVDVTDKMDVEMIATSGYELHGYTHQCWLTEDHKYLLVNDETDEITHDLNTRTFIWDVQDLDNPQLIGTYVFDNTSSDHNMYILKDVLYESNYRSGLRILDLTAVSEGVLEEIAWFDVIPEDDNTGYSGSWSNYPYFESQVMPVTNMYNGIHFLKPRLINIPQILSPLCNADEIQFEIESIIPLFGDVEINIFNLPEGVSVDLGNAVISTPGSTTATISGLSSLEMSNFDFVIELSNNDTLWSQTSTVVLSNESANIPVAVYPVNAIEIGQTFTTLIWEIGNGSQFDVQVALDPDFNDIIIDVSELSANQFTFQGMDFDTQYFWRVTAHNDCGGSEYSEVATFFTSGSVSVDDHGLENLRVFPNPVVEKIYFEGVELDTNWELHDISGRIMKTGKLSHSSFGEISVSEFPQGVYILNLEGYQPTRIIKK